MIDVHFSSKTDLWAAPQDFFDNLNAEFGFELDVRARLKFGNAKNSAPFPCAVVVFLQMVANQVEYLVWTV